ncbi:MAG: hypothetical protein ABSE82_11820 [Nitrososphaerales archaeon]|jgi:hypothetical protein
MSDKKELKLATYWQVQMSLYKGTVLSPLTPQEVGQIKSLFLKTGMLSKRMMLFAFLHWRQFTAETMAVTAFAACPVHPNIGYLLKHRNIAVSLMVKLKIIDDEEAELALEAAKYLD